MTEKLQHWVGLAVLALFFAMPALSADKKLSGLNTVQVAVEWPDATATASLKTEVTNKLQHYGIRILSQEHNTDLESPGSPVLLILVSPQNTEALVSVFLIEDVTPERSLVSYGEWIKKNGNKPVSDAEFAEHSGVMRAMTWERSGIAGTPAESVKSIVDRYWAHPYWRTPAGRASLTPLMEAEVQSAIENAKHPVAVAPVIDTARYFIDEFLNEWAAANPKTR